MSDSRTIVGIVSQSAGTREQLRRQLEAADFSCDLLEIDQYYAERIDIPKQLVELQPKIIIIDVETASIALPMLRSLHDALPETWLFVSSGSDDPQLIIEAVRAGAREFLPKPITPAALAQALNRYISEQQKGRKDRAEGNIYCVTSAKGGAGTTSVAINLAVATASAGDSRVSLVDLGSPVGDIAEYLNLKSRFNVADALASSSRMDPVLLESYMSRSHGVAVLPGQKEFNPDLQSRDSLSRIFRVLLDSYSHNFVDMACSQNREQMQVATEYSAAVLVVLTPELPALWRTERLIRTFEKIGGSAKVRLIVNRGGKREIGIREIEKALGHPIFWSLPNNYPAAIQAVNSGKPLVSVNHSGLAASYFELSQSLTGLPLARKRRGLFGW